jgi:hypothetical protein
MSMPLIYDIVAIYIFGKDFNLTAAPPVMSSREPTFQPPTVAGAKGQIRSTSD